VLLAEDHLLHEARVAPAVLRGPRHADPAVLPEQPLPLEPHVPAVLVSRAAAPSERRELADEVVGEPGPHLVAERRFVRRIPEIHGNRRSLTDRSVIYSRSQTRTRSACTRCAPVEWRSAERERSRLAGAASVREPGIRRAASPTG